MTPDFPADDEHDQLVFDLLDPTGMVVASFPVRAPLNKNNSAPFLIQVRVTHHDGCTRILQREPLAAY
jgi:hypothetical protein